MKIPTLSLLLAAVILILAGCAQLSPAVTPSLPPVPTATTVPTMTSSPTPTETATPVPTATQVSSEVITDDLFILSIIEAGYAHLFAYSPQGLPFTRLTYGYWDDIHPAISPDGTRIAFSSRRNGFWDLYILDLRDGQTLRITDTLAYDASPSWSPDGQWLVYETYSNNNLEIAIISIAEPGQGPILLTDHPAADHSPVWSPMGRQIAFISTRGGDAEVWLADLDRVGEERFTNISPNPNNQHQHPVWSPDGSRLAWSALDLKAGMRNLYIWDSTRRTQRFSGGDWPAWSSSGDMLATLASTPYESYITAYSVDGSLSLPPIQIPGFVRGYDWKQMSLTSEFFEAFSQTAEITPLPLWRPEITALSEGPAGRTGIVDLEEVQAPYPALSDQVDEAFIALRQRTSIESGWDALGSLQNAYIPLTAPLDPGLGESWLYTGRAFALNPAVLNAGWVVVVREDYGQQTFWRYYLRTFAQDGSQGEPLKNLPWDLAARYNLDPSAYEQGGKFAPKIPSGYWLDFTALANTYGWSRLPALSNWRTYFNGTRFNEFALMDGLEWRAAMLEIYPAEVLITPTVIIPPTRTPTRTPWFYQTPTPTKTPTPRPTFTPSP